MAPADSALGKSAGGVDGDDDEATAAAASCFRCPSRGSESSPNSAVEVADAGRPPAAPGWSRLFTWMSMICMPTTRPTTSPTTMFLSPLAEALVADKRWV